MRLPPDAGPPTGGDVADPAQALGLGGEPTHDYGSGPPGRWSRPWSPATATALTTLGALIVGFLLTAGMSAGRDAAQEQGERREQLISLIEDRQDHTDALGEQLTELREELATVQAEAAAGVPALSAEVERVEVAAGMTDVVGPGVRVTLADGPPDCSQYEDNCRIHDSDVQLAVNALFDLGAEAVAVNGERVITTTAIRSAGRAVLVNFRVLTNPYVIEAVGDPAVLHEQLASTTFAEQFETWEDLYGLGYSTELADELRVPAYGGSVRLRNATVGEEDRAAPPPPDEGRAP